MLKINILEELIGKSEQNNIPLFVLLELTYACNLMCRHCYITNRSRKNELSSSEIKLLINELKENNTMFLTLSGGELFLRNDIWNILENVYNSNFVITILTNGTFITDEYAKRLAGFSIWEVGISLYGTRAESHEYITGVKGSFKKTIKTIELLRENNIPVRIKHPIMKHNFMEYADVKKLARKLDAKYSFDYVITARNNGDTTPISLRIKDIEMESVIKREGGKWNFYSKEASLLCGAGKNFCSISPYGDVYPCVQLPKSAGNVKNSSFTKIWKHSGTLKDLREIKEEDIKKCYNCKLINFCNRCPGIAYIESGSLYDPVAISCKEAEIRVGNGFKPFPTFYK